MKVLLIQDVSGLGSLGDEVNAKPGFVRNFLLPNKQAVIINKTNLKKIEVIRKKLASKIQKSLALSKDLSDRINELELVFEMKSSPEGTLFGAVNDKMILDKLKEKGIEIDKKHAINAEHIKKIGEYSIPVNLHKAIDTNLKINIISQNQEITETKEASDNESSNIEPSNLEKKSENSLESESEQENKTKPSD